MRSSVVPPANNPSRPVSTLPIPVLEPAAKARFESKYQIDAAGCWLWTGTVTPHGYGQFRIGRVVYQAHRMSYVVYGGVIPAGLVLDHLCRVPLCVNPKHLDPVTQRENTIRGNTIIAAQIKRTHCPHGHPYSPSNTAISKNNARHCRTCHAREGRDRRRRQREFGK